MGKIVLTFGLLAGALLSVMMFLTIPFMDHLDGGTGAVIGYTTMVMAGLLTYFGVRSYRDNVAGGTVRFGRAFGVALLITLISTLCYVVSWDIIYRNITPDFMDKYADSVIERTRASGAPPEKVAAMVKQFDVIKVSYKDPFVRAAYTFIEPLPVGLLVSLISAVALSRKRLVAP